MNDALSGAKFFACGLPIPERETRVRVRVIADRVPSIVNLLKQVRVLLHTIPDDEEHRLGIVALQ